MKTQTMYLTFDQKGTENLLKELLSAPEQFTYRTVENNFKIILMDVDREILQREIYEWLKRRVEG